MADQEAMMQEHKRLFLARVTQELAKQVTADEHGRSQFLTGAKHDRITQVLGQWSSLDAKAKKLLQQADGNLQAYAWAKKYAVCTIGGAQVLIFKSAIQGEEQEAPAGCNSARSASAAPTARGEQAGLRPSSDDRGAARGL